MIIDRDSIENLVGTKISKIDLYQKAFSHKSALKEIKNKAVTMFMVVQAIMGIAMAVALEIF